MKFGFRQLKSLSFGILFTAFLIFILQSVAFFTCYDQAGANYFKHDAILPTVVIGLTLAACILAAVISFFAKSAELENRFPKLRRAFLLPGFGYAVCAVLICFSDLSEFQIFGVLLPSWLFPMFFFLSAIAFVLAATPAADKNCDYVAFFMLFPILSLLLLDSILYFDLQMEMNAPIKSAVMLSTLASAVYLLSEIRFFLSAPLQKIFLFTALLASVLTSVASVPLFVAYSLGYFKRADLLCGAILALSFLGLSVLRLISFFQENATSIAAEEEAVTPDDSAEKIAEELEAENAVPLSEEDGHEQR